MTNRPYYNWKRESNKENARFDRKYSQPKLEIILYINCLSSYLGLKFRFNFGSTINAFRTRYNNHRSSLSRYGKGKREICGQYLYSHFYSEGHTGVEDIQIQIIDVADVSQPTAREGFWIDKLNCYTPRGLNTVEL